jgi:hypothetical protein
MGCVISLLIRCMSKRPGPDVCTPRWRTAILCSSSSISDMTALNTPHSASFAPNFCFCADYDREGLDGDSSVAYLFTSLVLLTWIDNARAYPVLSDSSDHSPSLIDDVVDYKCAGIFNHLGLYLVHQCKDFNWLSFGGIYFCAQVSSHLSIFSTFQSIKFPFPLSPRTTSFINFTTTFLLFFPTISFLRIFGSFAALRLFADLLSTTFVI